MLLRRLTALAKHALEERKPDESDDAWSGKRCWLIATPAREIVTCLSIDSYVVRRGRKRKSKQQLQAAASGVDVPQLQLAACIARCERAPVWTPLARKDSIGMIA